MHSAATSARRRESLTSTTRILAPKIRHRNLLRKRATARQLLRVTLSAAPVVAALLIAAALLSGSPARAWPAFVIAAASLVYWVICGVCLRWLKRGHLDAASRLFVLGGLVVTALATALSSAALALASAMGFIVFTLIAIALELADRLGRWLALNVALLAAAFASRLLTPLPPASLGALEPALELALAAGMIVLCALIGRMTIVNLNEAIADTERSRLELERSQQLIIEAKDAAVAASKAKSAFLANMSHELRTPLNAIIGYSDMLRDTLVVDDDAIDSADALQEINRAGNNLLQVITDILDVSMIESGRADLSSEWFDVQQLLDELAIELRPALQRTGNRLQLQAESRLGAMYADRRKLRKLLLNLLDNANKFTAGGELELRARRFELRGAPHVRFVVRDSGIGIPEPELARLFQPFTQADESSTRAYGGAGLGLAITDHFTRLHGGTIDVESAQGVGSSFTVTLPAEQPGAE
ncbi:MAG: HAMP domain-containing histidine kinase [Myxococcales bacterium]|nr:HAMP domain-containing histidine kinase [Myxococcales bacterium]